MRAALCGFVLAFFFVLCAADSTVDLNFKGLIAGAFAQEAQPEQFPHLSVESIWVAPSDPNTVLGVLGSNDFYSMSIVNWITLSGLTASYSGSPITVFIPSQQAFLSKGIDSFKSYGAPENAERLAELLKYFVVNGKFLAADLKNGQVLQTLQGQTLTVTVDGTGARFINGFPVTSANNIATNGVVHIVDGFLEPLDILTRLTKEGGSHWSNFLTKLSDVGPSLALNKKYTFFAFPATSAPLFSAALIQDTRRFKATLLNHVLSSQVPYFSFKNTSPGHLLLSASGQLNEVVIKNCGIYVGGAKITSPDNFALNGLIHYVDRPIFLQDVLTAATNLGHTTFVSLVKAAGLESTFKIPCKRTVFIPTNAAFQALGASVLADLAKPQNKALLASVLNFHIVSGEELYSDLISNQTAITNNGRQLLSLSLNISGFFVNGVSQVLQADYIASNAIAHVVDAVLLPRTAAQLIRDSTVYSLSIFSELVKTVNLTFPTSKFTLFAPTNAAFGALPSSQLLQIQKNPTLALTILNFHIATNYSSATTWFNGAQLKTVQGGTLNIALAPGQLYKVNDASVILPDDFTTDGVVHLIDGVLIPSGVSFT